MALPLPEGTLFQITHKKRSGSYSMPSLEAALDHYSLSYLIQGDRTIITPTMTYTIHAGYVNAMAPYIYHQTVPASDLDYESIFIKFSPQFMKPYTDQLGSQFLDQIFSRFSMHFTEASRQKVYSLFCDLLEVSQKESAYREITLQSLLFRLLILLLEESLHDEEANMRKTPLSPPILEAIFYMEKNYAQILHIETVAEVSGYAVSYFSRLFQEQMGHSFSEYLCSIRLRHVESLLLSTDKSITDIALETGFQYPGNMTSTFRQKVGMTPREYRKTRRKLP
ncbi:MAG: helix-turn-helix domain-containing protein [Lachnospiraceae bacterium]